MERCAIIGFGCAGYHGAKALRTYGYTGEILVFTEDSEAPVNPMLTTYVAGGKLDAEDGFPFGRLEEIAGELDLKVHVGKVRKCVQMKWQLRRRMDGPSGLTKSLLPRVRMHLFLT